jgi:hypothetical protein
MDTAGIASAIIKALEEEKPVNLDALTQMLPAYTWNQVFVAVDTLTREGILTLRRADRLTYQVSLSLSHDRAA